MKVTVIGKQDVNFNDKATGKDIFGTTIYCTYANVNVEGYIAQKVFIRGQIADEVKLNGKYDIDFDPKGRVLAFVPA